MFILTPRLNTNEDQLSVVSVMVKDEDWVEKGDLLFVLESTKSAIDVLAETAGRICDLKATVDSMVDVGSILCSLTDGETSTFVDNVQTDDVIAHKEPHGNDRQIKKITTKARVLAETLGIDIAEVPSRDGVVGVREIENWRAASSNAQLSGVLPEQGGDLEAIVVGGGGHAATILDMLEGSGWKIIGCTDTIQPRGTRVLGEVAIIGSQDILDDLIRKGIRYAFIGVGGSIDNGPRRQIYNLLKNKGFILPPFVHKSAHFGHESSLGSASYVFPGAMVGPRVRIGDNVIINSGSIICHDSRIESHAHVAPGGILAGWVKLGADSTLGMGACVLDKTSIGSGCLVHNNASVISNLADNMELNHMGRTRAKHSPTKLIK